MVSYYEGLIARYSLALTICTYICGTVVFKNIFSCSRTTPGI